MPPKKSKAIASVQQDRAFDMAVSGQRAESSMPTSSTLMTLMPLAEIAHRQSSLDKLGLGFIVDEETAYMQKAASIVQKNPGLKFQLGCSGMALVALVAQRLKDRVAEREGEALIEAAVNEMVREKPGPALSNRAIEN